MKSKGKSCSELLREMIAHALSMVCRGGKRTALTISGIALSVSMMVIVTQAMYNSFQLLKERFSNWPDNVCVIEGDGIEETMLKDYSEHHPQMKYNCFFFAENVDLSRELELSIIGVRKGFLSGYLPNLDGGVYQSTLLTGRDFSDAELYGYESAAIISESASLALFGTPHGEGRTLQIKKWGLEKEFRIIGIIKDSFHTAYDYETFQKNKGNDFNSLRIFLYTPVANLSEMKILNYAILFSDDESPMPYMDIISYFTTAQDVSISVDSAYSKQEQFYSDIADFNWSYYPLMGIIMLSEIVVLFLFLTFSMKERIREIGIRKAIGADNSQICLQFLLENIFIGFVGTSLGCVIGAFLYVVYLFVIGWNCYFVLSNINWLLVGSVFAFSFSAVVLSSLASGIIGKKIKIADALRYE